MTRMAKFAFLVIIFVGLSPAFGASTDKNSEMDTTTGRLQPKLSATGLQRVSKNIEVLNQNIKDAQTNLDIIQKNLKTLQIELDDVSALEKEHQELRAQYDAYLVDAAGQLAKTDTQLQKIAKLERENASSLPQSIGSNAKGGPSYDAQKVTLEKSKLEDWKSDAAPKINKVSELIRELKENLSQIGEKRLQLKKDVSVWTENRREFDSLLKQYNAKKAELQKLAERESD